MMLQGLLETKLREWQMKLRQRDEVLQVTREKLANEEREQRECVWGNLGRAGCCRFLLMQARRFFFNVKMNYAYLRLISH